MPSSTKLTRSLIDTAMGRVPADLVILNGKWVSVRAVAVRGTTGMFIDPHEMANVFGLKGVRLIMNEAQKQPIHVWVQMPSCVPSAPGLETPGAHIGPKGVAQAMKWKGIIGLGEMMNFQGVFMGDQKMLAELSITHAHNKTIG